MQLLKTSVRVFFVELNVTNFSIRFALEVTCIKNQFLALNFLLLDTIFFKNHSN